MDDDKTREGGAGLMEYLRKRLVEVGGFMRVVVTVREYMCPALSPRILVPDELLYHNRDWGRSFRRRKNKVPESQHKTRRPGHYSAKY